MKELQAVPKLLHVCRSEKLLLMLSHFHFLNVTEMFKSGVCSYVVYALGTGAALCLFMWTTSVNILKEKLQQNYWLIVGRSWGPRVKTRELHMEISVRNYVITQKSVTRTKGKDMLVRWIYKLLKSRLWNNLLLATLNIYGNVQQLPIQIVLSSGSSLIKCQAAYHKEPLISC